MAKQFESPELMKQGKFVPWLYTLPSLMIMSFRQAESKLKVQR
jgi:hypothetical protein